MILPKSKQKILKLIYENPGIRLTELIKRARVSVATAKKILDYFISSEIIIEKKITGGKRILLKNFYPNFSSEEGKHVFSLIESGKKQEFFEKNKRLLNPFKQLLKNINKKIKVILIFGSFARYSQTKDSDLDILFLMSKKINESEKNILKKEVERSFITLDNEVSLRIDTLNNFKKNLNKSIYETIIKDHIIIKGALDFLEIIK